MNTVDNPVEFDTAAAWLKDEILSGELIEIDSVNYSLEDVENYVFGDEKLAGEMSRAFALCSYGHFCQGGLQIRAIFDQAAMNFIDKKLGLK